ncbi:MAG TPA: VOC family protein [Syntrophomonadaceae bacterium]|nr:VOC family protein [Syntrophomonadaceae bacterium]
MIESSQKIKSFLTFPGTAEEAVNFYVSLFPGAKILEMTRFVEGQFGEVGKVLNATFELKGVQFMAMDMDRASVVDFSWAISLQVDCLDEPEFDTLFTRLAEGGTVMMGPEPVLAFRKVAWVTDRFGVTWQLVWQ